jgi:hypothetical protein
MMTRPIIAAATVFGVADDWCRTCMPSLLDKAPYLQALVRFVP